MSVTFEWKAEEKWMMLALEEAQKAFDNQEVPIGAVLVCSNELVASASNRVERSCDASTHAELECLRRGAEKLERWRLSDCVLYCTLEPCLMCYGAMVHFRLGALVFGAPDLRHGALGSLYDLSQRKHPIHNVPFQGSFMLDPCRDIIQDFFRKRRKGAQNGSD